MLKTRMVDAFIGIPVKPIMAAVKMSGITFGVSDMSTIRHDENIMAINNEISRIASPRLVNKFFSRYWVPLNEVMLEPVTVTSYLSEVKTESISALKLS